RKSLILQRLLHCISRYVNIPESVLHEEVSREVSSNFEDQTIEYQTSNGGIDCKIYKRRWIMLALYLSFSFVSCIQWIQYAIINNLVMKYYNVSSVAVDWTSIIFMGGFIPFIFPAMYILEKKGLKWTIFLGASGTAIGACIKALSVSPERFWGALVGQAFVGSSQVFLLGVPPNLAAVWFGSDQVSTACSICVFGNLFGVAIGFLLPSYFVRNHGNVEDIGSDLSLMFNCTAGLCILQLILDNKTSGIIIVTIVIIFQAEPPMPPSPEQAFKKTAIKGASFFGGIKNLLMNKGFILLISTYSVNVAALNSFSTLLNQLILPYFPVRYCSRALGMLILTFSLAPRSEIIVHIAGFIFGLFNAGYMPVGFEFGSEITYPEPEGTTGGLIILTTQIVSVLHAMAYSELVRSIGDVWADMILTISLVIGTFLTAMIPNDLRRQAAHKVKTLKHLQLHSVDKSP
ncbi:putative MFS-type transporter C09D4.1, partial [Blattella germanica]